MRYELTVVTPGNRPPKEAEQDRAGVRRLLEEEQAKVTNEQAWGRRDLAYPINKLTSGYYSTFEFEAPTGAVTAVERALRLTAAVLRFLTVVAPKNPSPLLDGKLAETKAGRSAEEQLRRQAASGAGWPATSAAKKTGRTVKAPVKKTAKIDEAKRAKQVEEALSKILE